MRGVLARRALAAFALVAAVLLHGAALHSGPMPPSPMLSAATVQLVTSGGESEADGSRSVAGASDDASGCSAPHGPAHAPTAADSPRNVTSIPVLLPAASPVAAEIVEGRPCAIAPLPAPAAAAGAGLCTELCVSRR